MIRIRTARHLHSELADVCGSLEATFKLAQNQYDDIELAVRPAMRRFRELLDAGDLVVGPDPDWPEDER